MLPNVNDRPSPKQLLEMVKSTCQRTQKEVPKYGPDLSSKAPGSQRKHCGMKEDRHTGVQTTSAQQLHV